MTMTPDAALRRWLCGLCFLQAVLLREAPFRERLYRPLNPP